MASRIPKVFLDSSVLTAAAISHRGSARELISAGLHGDDILVVSTLVLRETETNIIAKAPRALDMLAASIKKPLLDTDASRILKCVYGGGAGMGNHFLYRAEWQ